MTTTESSSDDLKFTRLKTKYDLLLSCTSNLFDRQTRRHRSLQDLQRSVLYLRSLYNQLNKSAKSDHNTHSFLTISPENATINPEESYLEDDDDLLAEELLSKTTFMVEEDKEYRLKKRIAKERNKGERKLAMWQKWQKERAQIE